MDIISQIIAFQIVIHLSMHHVITKYLWSFNK